MRCITPYVLDDLEKKMHFLEDRDGYRYELRYIRDKEGRKVDFALIKEGQVEELIEAKYSDSKISKSLLYYANRLKPRRVVRITANIKHPYDKNHISVLDPISYFRAPP